MRRIGFAMTVLCLAAAPSWAASSEPAAGADAANSDSSAGAAVAMAKLIDQGYEIKTAVPSGDGKLIIFVQKDKSAYACEFTNLANTRCGSIN